MQRHIVIYFLFLSGHLIAQEFNYIHYDTKDGLASATVYNITQDKKGYMWFCTDNGISRFDGKKFTNLTTDHGISDNEVMSIYADTKGRVWIMPFNKSLSYYFEGSIYHVTGVDSIRKEVINSYFSFVGEDVFGNCYFHTNGGLLEFSNSGSFKVLADYKKLMLNNQFSGSRFIPVNIPDKSPYPIHLFVGKSLFVIKNDSLLFVKNIKGDVFRSQMNFYSIDANFEPLYPKSENLYSFNSVYGKKHSAIYFNTQNGAWLIDKEGNVGKKPFLKDKKVSSAYQDTEGNLWFATLGEGVYRLTSGSMKTFANNTEAFSIEKTNGKIYAGLADGRLETIHNLLLQNEYTPASHLIKANSQRLYTIKTEQNGVVYLGYDSHLEKLYKGKHLTSPLRPIKSIDIIDEHYIVACTNSYTCKVRSADLKITDTIWQERGTKVVYQQGSYYIGTLTGLVIIDPMNKITKTAPGIPLLSGRIVDICKAGDGGIWVATNDKGVIRYNNNRVETVINTGDGLSSNSCKTLFLKNQYLWAGTNKGINKIDLHTNKVIAKYTTADGLGSDIINALYIEDSLVWVCSPAGVTFFNENNISDSSICNLDLHRITVSGKKIDSLGLLNLSYKNNNISFEYAGISFKSAGDIVYRYKLTGLDNDWNETNLTTLAYPSLPAGHYTFQIFAINKFGKHSEMIVIKFSIAAPYWQKLWFWLLISLSVLGLISWLITRRYKKLQQRAKEKNDLAKRIADLEQASLRAQMNPHFIFNCLNSIQHFILKNDFEKTNEYITQFGSLIRQTLDNSAKTNITIANEVKYLGGYLELEKMRFSSSFTYSIHIDRDIPADYTYVPSMILQPFVENAIRHGIRHKKDGTGIINISITKQQEGILFTLEDNGVGREAAALNKSYQHIEYQSKGIMLATNRLELLAASSEEKITTLITDLTNENGSATGTKVEIYFPDSIIEKLH